MKKKIDWELLKDEWENMLIIFDEQPIGEYVIKAEWLSNGEMDLVKASSDYIQNIAFLYIMLKQSILEEQFEISSTIKRLINCELKNFLRIKSKLSEKREIDKIIKKYTKGMETLFEQEIDIEFK